MRDPFVFRGHDGRFHLLSTNGWKSVDIFHAVSNDLISWRAPKLIPVMESVAGTRNCWAPEAIWDETRGHYRIFWSSTTPLSYGESDAHGCNHRIWSLTTPDSESFSAPQIWFDPGYNAIDATVAASPDGGYLMAFKDERGANTRDTPHKAIRLTRADDLGGPWQIREEFVSPRLTEGPILFRANNRWLLFFDCFMDKKWGGIQSADGGSWRDISDQIRFPAGPRHGSVLEIAEGEAARLRAAFGP